MTGIFDFTAYRLVLAVGGSGITLMLGVYLFASVLTIFTSNDIVILTLTPILFHVGRHARIDVKPLLFAEFFGANTLSMLLVVGNPTNIIISRTMGIGFVEYTRVMWPSTLTAFFLTGALLLLVFRRSIPRRIELHPDAMFHIRNRLDAGLSTAMMAATFAAFVLSDRYGYPLWVASAVSAACFTIEDLAFTLYYGLGKLRRKRRNRASTCRGRHHAHILPTATLGEPDIRVEKEENLELIPEVTNDLYLAHMRVPWKILPLIVACFILVDAIGRSGAAGWAAEFLSNGGTPFSTVLRTGFSTALLANLVNNQPASMFVAMALNTLPSGSPFRAAAGFAAVISSNLAANLTILGALAGLMWRRILGHKGLTIGYGEFLSIGIRITPIVLASALAVLFFMLG